MELNNSGHCILQMETNDINIRSEQAEMWRGLMWSTEQSMCTRDRDWMAMCGSGRSLPSGFLSDSFFTFMLLFFSLAVWFRLGNKTARPGYEKIGLGQNTPFKTTSDRHKPVWGKENFSDVRGGLWKNTGYDLPVVTHLCAHTCVVAQM